ncbi:hypothetical protein DAVIS_02162 [Mycobacterium marinum]|uniref:Uncharacterized protein n=1 Tax=Mycobacterium marinum TaxID=1781 RepID=A0A3E2MXF7_MYCMR|nr:hypothetical protein DAVIS_02162 [Mycobacterium marinum]
MQGGVGGGDQTHRRERISAEFEERVGGADPVHTEDLGVEAGQDFFHRSLRGEISLGGGVVGGGQSAAVEDFFHRSLRGEISLGGGVVGGGQSAAVEFAVDR